ncbi:MAG: hypothetical protein ACF8NJ_04060 [Phycisphaerales bacterium JB038]
MPRKSSQRETKYLEPYRQALDQYGPSFEATLWFNEEVQIRRFDVLAEMLDPTGLRLLDAGCAQGELVHRLVEVGKSPGAYVGLDAFSDFTDAGRTKAPGAIAECRFEAIDFVLEEGAFARYEPEIVFFSGSLNTLSQAQAQQVVRRAYEAATVGVAFNFLSDRHHPRFDDIDVKPAQRFRTAKMVDWALSLSHLVRFRQDYFEGHDASICIRKVDPPS